MQALVMKPQHRPRNAVVVSQKSRLHSGEACVASYCMAAGGLRSNGSPWMMRCSVVLIDGVLLLLFCFSTCTTIPSVGRRRASVAVSSRRSLHAATTGHAKFRRRRVAHEKKLQQQRDLQNGTSSPTMSAFASQKFAPMRIHFDTSRLESRFGEGDETDVEISKIIDEILPAAAAKWSQHLSVLVPVDSSSGIVLPAHECDLSEWTNETTVFNADLVILVGGDANDNCGPKQLAYARPCSLDSLTDRPITGAMEFCLNLGNRTFRPLIYEFELSPYFQNATGAVFREDHLHVTLLEITVHEMGHILGFASDLFAYFRDENGQPRMARDSASGGPIPVARTCGDGNVTDGTAVYNSLPSDDIVRVVKMDDGSYQQFLITPKVQVFARNHFNCSSLLGGRLDDAAACIGSHWNERHYYGSLMGPVASKSSENSLSLITLGLMEDSGWYRVDYRGGAQPAFGLGAGCGFVTQACISNTTRQVADSVVNEFCAVPLARVQAPGVAAAPDFFDTNVFCDPAYRSWTLCDLVQHDDGTTPKPSYFASPQLAPFFLKKTDGCPIPDIGLGLDCRIDAPYNTFYPGEVVGAGSRCINSFYGGNSSVGTSFRPACMPTACDTKARTVRIGQGTYEQVCSADGEELPVFGRSDAFFVCPRLAAVCPELFACPDGCFGRGECVYPGSGSMPYCQCFDVSNTDQLACAPPYIVSRTSNAATGAPALVASAPTTAPQAAPTQSIILVPAAIQPVNVVTQAPVVPELSTPPATDKFQQTDAPVAAVAEAPQIPSPVSSPKVDATSGSATWCRRRSFSFVASIALFVSVW